MAEPEQIAGISVGVAADLNQLEDSLRGASAKIDRWATTQEKRHVVLTADTKVDDSDVKRAKATLAAYAKELGKGLYVPIRMDLVPTKGTISAIRRDLRAKAKQAGGIEVETSLQVTNKDKLQNQLKTSLGTIPVLAEGEWKGWKGDITPTVAVNVVGHFVDWDDNGPPDVGGGGAPPRRGGPRRPPAPDQPAQQRPSNKERQAAKETGAAVAEAINEKPVKVEPSPKQETKAQATREQIVRSAATGGPARRGPQKAAAVSDIAAEMQAAVTTGAPPEVDWDQPERFQQGGENVVECPSCHQIVPARSYPAHKGVHTRRRREAEREQEAIGRRQQADVTLHRRGIGEAEREPERAEAISEYEFTHGMGSQEEMAARSTAWARVKAAIAAGAEPSALLEEAKVVPAEGSAGSLQTWLATDEGKEFSNLLSTGLAARKGTGARTGPETPVEEKATRLEQQGFALGGALMRAGIAEGIPQDLTAGPRRRPQGRIDEAAGRLYEAQVIAQRQIEAATLAEAKKNVASGAFSKKYPDIVGASNEAIEAARSAIEMPNPRGKRGLEARNERSQAIAGALGQLYPVASQLRATYTKPRSYRRLITGRRPRQPSSERDLAVLQTQGFIQQLLEEQRATTGHERDVAEAAEKARETAEIASQGSQFVPVTARQIRARRGGRGPTGGLASLNPAPTVMTRTLNPRQRRGALDKYVDEAPLIEVEEGQSVRAASEIKPYASDIAELEAGLETAFCPICATVVPKADMQSGAHFNSPRHIAAARMGGAVGGPREFAGGPYNPGVQGQPIRRPGETGSQYLARLQGTGGMDRPQAATPAEEPWQPAWRRRAAAKDLTPERYFAGEYNPEAEGKPGQRLRVKDLTPEELAQYRRANKALKAAGQKPVTPAELRTFNANEAGEQVVIEPEPPVQTKAPAQQAATPPQDYTCGLCGVRVRDRATHEATARHQRNLRKQVQIEPEPAGRAADVSSEEDKQKFADRLRRAGVSEEEIASQTGQKPPTTGTVYCPVCQRNVRAAGHEQTVGHQNALRGQAAVSAGGVGVESEERAAETAERYVSPSGIRRSVGEATYAGFQREAERSLVGVRDSIQDINDFGREVLEENPVRALSVAVSQIAVNLTGRAELKNTIGDINRQARDASGLADDALKARRDLAAAQKGILDPKLSEDQVKELQEQLPRLQAASDQAQEDFKAVFGAPLNILEEVQKLPRRDQQRRIRELGAAALAAEENPAEPQTLLARREVLARARPGILARTAAVSTVGIVAGTALFSAAMGAFNAAMSLGAEWVGRVTDEMFGFNDQANRLAQTLGQGALATGRVQPGLALQLGQAGIGGDIGERIAANIAPRIEGEMAAQRTTILRDTLALNAQSLRDRALHPDVRNYAGVFQPTGGLTLPIIGPTNIGAQQSVQETLAQMLGGQPSSTPFDILTNQGQGLPSGDQLLSQVPVLGAFTQGMFPSTAIPQAALDQAAADTRATLNAQLARGAQPGQEAFQFRNPTTQGVTGDIGQQVIALQAMGASPDFINRVRSGDIALTDAQGNLLTSTKQLGEFFDQFVEGAKPALDQLLSATKRPLEAQFFSINQALQRQLQITNPIQAMQQQALQPVQRFGTGLVPMFGGVPSLAGAPPGVTDAFSRYFPQATNIESQIRTYAMKGWDSFVSEVRQSPVIDNPDQVIGQMQQVQDLGKQLADEQQRIASMNVSYQWDQYNVQVMRAQRNLGDLAALVKNNNGIEATRVGQLNAENLAIDRQLTRLGRVSQALSLQMQQRQINFQLATSEFTAAGETPAEAAANRRQAEVEARFAQRQLDIQKQMFGLQGTQFNNQIQIVDEQNLRAFQDAVVDFNLFQEGFKNQQINQGFTQLAGDIQTLQQQLLADVNANIGAVNSTAQAEIDAVASAFQQGSDNLQDVAREVKKVYADVAKDFLRDMGLPISTYGDASLGPQGGSALDYSGKPMAAGGMLATSSSPTEVIYGEAGTETLAILRNPRTMRLTPTGGGTGTSYFSFTFSGDIHIREEADLEKLSRKITARLNQEAGLYGMRR